MGGPFAYNDTMARNEPRPDTSEWSLVSTSGRTRLDAHLAAHVSPEHQRRMLDTVLALLRQWDADILVIDYRAPTGNSDPPTVRLVPCRNAAAKMVSKWIAREQPARTPSRACATARNASPGDAVHHAARLMASLALAWPSYARPERMIAYSDGHAIAFCPETPALEWPGAHRSGPPSNAPQNALIEIAPAGSTGLLARAMTELSCKKGQQVHHNQ